MPTLTPIPKLRPMSEIEADLSALLGPGVRLDDLIQDARRLAPLLMEAVARSKRTGELVPAAVDNCFVAAAAIRDLRDAVREEQAIADRRRKRMGGPAVTQHVIHDAATRRLHRRAGKSLAAAGAGSRP